MVKIIVEKKKKNPKKSKISSSRTGTGIYGLDKLIEGGIPNNNIISLAGTSGSGKTIFGLQFLCKGASEYNEPGVFVSLEEDPERLIKTCESFGWDARKLIKENKLIIAKNPLYKFNVLKEIIRDNVSEINAKRLVIDPGAMLDLFFERPIETRKAVVELGVMLKKLNCTCIVTNEETRYNPNRTDYSSDGIIYLFYHKVMNQFMRMISVVKMRGTKHSEKIHPMKITNKGIEVLNEEEVFQNV
ncbi:MAG: ATPase domain-containing protein [Patescibacteria group bacterium]|nr:ATPase domain-containing protein [Patescibacteria group bacterium]